MARPLDEDHALVALGLATAGVNLFSAANPSIFTIRRLGVDGEVKARDIRHGEMVAGGLTLALGLVTAGIMDHPAPAVMALVVVAVMVAMYEWALATGGEHGGAEEGE